ncbi:MAG: S16 family serine protease, partial [Ilumatobacteraceae bacterium]
CSTPGECSSQPEIDFITREEKFGTQSPTQRRTISLQMMRTSSQVAQYVALQALGYDDAQILPGEVVVADIVCLEEGATACTTYAPADAVLDPGDTILTADGVPLDTVEDLVAELAGKQPGDTVELTIDRPGSGEQTATVELIASPDDPERTIIGFVPFDTATVQLPFEIDIDTGSIGGPSAGLAFTLTLIDELSPGDLTGGDDVAVTGEINLDGTVGAIGGLAQKVSAVRQVGVKHFLVPAAQGDEQIARARQIGGDDVEIIPVATLDEALAALQRLGGDPLPAPS